jgi:cysteinyl-tRNA synthetase
LILPRPNAPGKLLPSHRYGSDVVAVSDMSTIRLKATERFRLRTQRRFAEADAIRSDLATLGVWFFDDSDRGYYGVVGVSGHTIAGGVILAVIA